MNVNNDYYIYEHWRPDTNSCFYVGKGRNKRAWNMLNRNVDHKLVQQELADAGLVIDIRIIIRDLSNDTALSVEKDKIAFYGIENLVNRSRGGCGSDGYKHTDEARKKISIGLKNSEGNKKHISNLAVKNKGNIYNVGSKHSENHKKKISISLIGNKRNLGKTASVETKAKMSVAQTGKIVSKETGMKISESKYKKIICLNDGMEFKSIKHAAEFYGIKKAGNISLVCKGKRKTTGKRSFKYVEEA